VTNDDVIAHVSHALAATRAEIEDKSKTTVGQRSTGRQCGSLTRLRLGFRAFYFGSFPDKTSQGEFGISFEARRLESL
jgi:hypothetical protein